MDFCDCEYKNTLLRDLVMLAVVRGLPSSIWTLWPQSLINFIYFLLWQIKELCQIFHSTPSVNQKQNTFGICIFSHYFGILILKWETVFLNAYFWLYTITPLRLLTLWNWSRTEYFTQQFDNITHCPSLHWGIKMSSKHFKYL